MRGSYSGLERVRKDSRLREGVAVERGTEIRRWITAQEQEE